MRFDDRPQGAGGPADTLPRLAARARLAGLGAEEAEALALAYGLVTERTSCVLVHEREHKVEGLPALRPVPQVLAAGWGGLGSVGAASDLDYLPLPAFLRRQTGPFAGACPVPPLPEPDFLCEDAELDYLEIPDSDGLDNPPGRCGSGIEPLIAALDARYAGAQTLDIRSLADLSALGLDGDLAEGLKALAGRSGDEASAVAAFLAALLDSPAGKALSRHVRRLIRRLVKPAPVDADLKRAAAALLGPGRI